MQNGSNAYQETQEIRMLILQFGDAWYHRFRENKWPEAVTLSMLSTSSGQCVHRKLSRVSGINEGWKDMWGSCGTGDRALSGDTVDPVP
jgi:hypothetical protein